ncbi:hypothetical protein EVAR_91419_1 [Eumeta japonica]|uniref:Uncharacterized protein n=1 Tax=Eumeta variegata TaxID=151549 RepID=A0A4C1XB10_EUMVA|nr:hypothetical protein EVAR_91419_1 [Eumeta japonica]
MSDKSRRSSRQSQWMWRGAVDSAGAAYVCDVKRRADATLLNVRLDCKPERRAPRSAAIRRRVAAHVTNSNFV